MHQMPDGNLSKFDNDGVAIGKVEVETSENLTGTIGQKITLKPLPI
jgi:hypothetical protein